MGDPNHDRVAAGSASSNFEDESSGPDGGRQGLIAVLVAWTRGFVWVGVFKGLGVMLPTLQDQFGMKASIMGSVSVLFVAAEGIIGNF